LRRRPRLKLGCGAEERISIIEYDGQLYERCRRYHMKRIVMYYFNGRIGREDTVLVTQKHSIYVVNKRTRLIGCLL
jgi:hypothetical protein